MVHGFLKFARPEELKLQPVQLAALISDVATILDPEAERCNVVVKVDCRRVLPPINADPGDAAQAILNLAINACQAMPDRRHAADLLPADVAPAASRSTSRIRASASHRIIW